MPDLCVDTYILLKAEEERCVQRQLLVLIGSCKPLKLALEPRIVQEYNNKMRADRFGQKWLQMMSSSGRTKNRLKIPLPRGTLRLLLDKIHFDPDDIMFLEVGLATEAKLLVAEERGYTPPVKKLMKKQGLSILTSPEAIEAIRANFPDETLSESPCEEISPIVDKSAPAI